MSFHESWPESPSWAETGKPVAGPSPEACTAPEQVERQFLLEVTVGQSTARVEEYHLRAENGGLVHKVGPFVSFSPDDLSPEMASDTLLALGQLLEKYHRI